MAASITVDLLIYRRRRHLDLHHPRNRKRKIRRELIWGLIRDDVPGPAHALLVEFILEHRVFEVAGHNTDAESLNLQRLDVFDTPGEHWILAAQIFHRPLYPLFRIETIPGCDQNSDARARTVLLLLQT